MGGHSEVALSTSLLLLLVLAGSRRARGLAPTPPPPPIHTVEVDVGRNVTVACANEETPVDADAIGVMWKRAGQLNARRSNVFSNRALELVNVTLDDAGSYLCILDDDEDTVRTRINIEVKSPPPALRNVWVKPSTILANVLWEVGGNGGYPIIDFTAEYRPKPLEGHDPEDWRSIVPTHIPPNSRQIDVYHLEPNTTYMFRVWATNKLGRGEIVEVEGRTHYTIEELELAKHLLAGFETFDRRIWVAAVGIVMGTLMILGLGTCYLLYRECKAPSQLEDQDVIELVPNIILNPGFFDERTERVPQDENFNDRTTTRLNNNTVLQPRRL